MKEKILRTAIIFGCDMNGDFIRYHNRWYYVHLSERKVKKLKGMCKRSKKRRKKRYKKEEKEDMKKLILYCYNDIVITNKMF